VIDERYVSAGAIASRCTRLRGLQKRQRAAYCGASFRVEFYIAMCYVIPRGEMQGLFVTYYPFLLGGNKLIPIRFVSGSRRGRKCQRVHWYKDFGSFKVCGRGQFPKTFLLRGQVGKLRRFDENNRRGRDGRYQPPPAQTRTRRNYCIRFLPWMCRHTVTGVETSVRLCMQ
jgi:hypothetical protein